MATVKTRPQYRHFALDRSALDTEARTVSLAFSSEAPVERHFGTEVLDHSPQSIRLGRLQNGGPLLVDHDPTDHIGVIEEVQIGADRVGRAVVRFGKSARAQEVFQDVQDGIRRHISVGYLVHKMQQERASDGSEIMRVVDFEPLEISVVSVPADPHVGIGRAAEQEIDTEVVREEAPAVEAEAEPAPVEAEPELRAAPFIEVIDNTPSTPAPKEQSAMSQVDLSPAERQQYSYARAIAASLARAEGQNVSGFEVEISQDIERNMPAEYARPRRHLRAALPGACRAGDLAVQHLRQGRRSRIHRTRRPDRVAAQPVRCRAARRPCDDRPQRPGLLPEADRRQYGLLDGRERRDRRHGRQRHARLGSVVAEDAAGNDRLLPPAGRAIDHRHRIIHPRRPRRACMRWPGTVPFSTASAPPTSRPASMSPPTSIAWRWAACRPSAS